MQLLMKLNRNMEKCMPLLTPACLIIGIVFSQFFKKYTWLVPWFFAIMTFAGSNNSTFRDMKMVFQKPVLLLGILILIHVLIPFTASIIANCFFASNPNFVLGIVLEFSVPTAVIGLMWVSVYKGNTAFSLAFLLVDTIFSPVLTPLSLRIFAGSIVTINPLLMMRDLILMITVPALLALSINHFTKGKSGRYLSVRMAPVGKFCLLLNAAINSSKVEPFIRHLTPQMIGVAVCVGLLLASGYFWGGIVAKLFRMKYNNFVSYTIGSGIRNTNAAAIIALQYFAAEVMFPVMISTLFQQVLAATAGMVIKKFFSDKHKVKNKK